MTVEKRRESDYDSRADTMEHIAVVQAFLIEMAQQLLQRAANHDASKLAEPEKSAFDQYTPELRKLTYGSPEYRQALAHMQDALDHHYAHNRHHPEHHLTGIEEMDLIDLIEMLADWKAATLRHDDGDLLRSIAINTTRFEIPEALANLLTRSAARQGWL
jgi:hypothetical protein